LVSQRAGDEIAFDAGAGNALFKPATHIVVQADAMHVVVERFIQGAPETVVVDAAGVGGGPHQVAAVGGQTEVTEKALTFARVINKASAAA